MTISLTALFIVAVAIMFSFFDFGGRDTVGKIVLPRESTGDMDVDIGDYSDNLEMLKAVTVSVDNIQDIIQAMKRPDRYRLSVNTTLYYDGGQSTFGAESHVWGERKKIVVYNSDGLAVSHCLISGGNIYMWSGGSRSYYSGKLGSFTADDYMYIPTYEDIIYLDKQDILSADFSLYNEMYCICIEVQDKMSGYRSLYYISAENGLLAGAQSFDGEDLVYSLTADILDFEGKEEDIFALPDGTVVEEESDLE